jgi:hypothetical protein
MAIADFVDCGFLIADFVDCGLSIAIDEWH